MNVRLVGQDRRGGRLQEDVIESERFLKLHANLRAEKRKPAALGGTAGLASRYTQCCA